MREERSRKRLVTQVSEWGVPMEHADLDFERKKERARVTAFLAKQIAKAFAKIRRR